MRMPDRGRNVTNWIVVESGVMRARAKPCKEKK